MKGIEAMNSEKVHLRSLGSDNPWFGHLLVSYGSSGVKACPGELRVWHPPTDVYETDSHVMIKIEVAGVDVDDLVVRLHGRVLDVHGCREDPAAKLSYQQMEISYGEFRSEVYLPCPVDETAATASYDKGFLHIRLPKAQQERKVPVIVVLRR
ncbi:MAG: Hsp20/alpha crystallin family protein [Chloroflexi bacterium]|nr:Hsp20/alpha crystallin family protein [Chloroflexota bacterium]